MIGQPENHITGPATQRGFTLVEVSVASTLLLGIFLLLNTTVLMGRRTSNAASAEMQVALQVRTTLGRLTDELRNATRVGEDVNADLTLDGTEDLNGNGILDADWEVLPSSITFNRMGADGKISTKITYRLNGTVVERVSYADGGTKPIVVVVAKNVTTFNVSDTGQRVTITLGLIQEGEGIAPVTETLTVTATPRN